MAGINENKGPGWGDHNTPYGTIHSYTDPGTHSTPGKGGSAHTNIGPKTKIHLDTTKDYDGFFMTQCLNNLKNHEGFRNNMYADTKGNITVGIGRFLANVDMALNMPFKYTYHQSRGGGDSTDIEMGAKPEQIRDEYNYLKMNHDQASKLHLSNDDVIKVCLNDVKVAETGLRGLFSNYDSFSNSAKTGLIDMAFTMGITHLKNEFPRFNEAVKKGDWTTAALESHRPDVGSIRNNDTAENFKQAALGH